jgi:hypothetical protein
MREFRDRQNAAKYAEIYGAASNQFRASATQEQFTALMELVRARLGRHRSGTVVKPTWILAENGSLVTLEVKSLYERGEATELFVFFISKDDETTLEGYRIDSPLLGQPGKEL